LSPVPCVAGTAGADAAVVVDVLLLLLVLVLEVVVEAVVPDVVACVVGEGVTCGVADVLASVCVRTRARQIHRKIDRLHTHFTACIARSTTTTTSDACRNPTYARAGRCCRCRSSGRGQHRQHAHLAVLGKHAA
jgi:hypothetical protein